jgi:2,4-dienoyl-CoA reductase-like NADH-dependent reductase (Old Yellow Enzyme family)
MFEPIRINSLELRNRFMRSATFENTADEGKVTDELIGIYRELARGEIGLIVTGAAYVRHDGYISRRQTAIDSEDCIPYLRRMVEAVHEFEGKIAIQIHHAGRKAGPESPHPPISSSAVPDKHTGVKPRELVREEVEELVECFVEGTRRAVEAGFDAIQLHGAHGFLMNQFLSPHTNRREDEWGGSTEGRIRFVSEVMRRARALVGPEYPIFIKLGVEEYVEGGLQPEEGVLIARRLCEMGADAVEPSVGIWEEPPHPNIRLVKREHAPFLLKQAAAVKSAVDKPVMAVGGMRDPSLIQQILDNRQADIISMCRPFIREPHLLLRWEEGDPAPARCISCNLCYKGGSTGPLRCRQDRP